jgi:Tfp pilus assembly protein PilV
MREKRYLRRLRAYLSGTRRRIHAERGFALIEVVVSAGLLMVVAGGVLAGIDGPSKLSGQNEGRSQASALAQQDQERMRSMPFSSLVGYTATTPITVGGVTYSRYSKAIWIRDNNDTDSCSTPPDDTSGDYLKITSKVTPPGNQAPVQLDSLVAAPAGGNSTKGTLAVQIKDQADQPVVGQSVSITGPVNMTVTTNSVGCAVFGLVEKGNYNVTFSRTGWVDPSSTNLVSRATSVTAGSTTIVTHNYAQAGTINVTVDTKVGNAAPQLSPAKGITVANIGIPTGTLTFPAPATPPQGSSSFTLNVYPFTSGYGVWAGVCASGDPTLYGQTAVTATPLPGGSKSVTVRQPSIVVTSATNTPLGTYPTQPNEILTFTSIDANCAEARTQTAGAGGVEPYPGMPYGNYKLCGSFSGYNAKKNAHANNVPAGQSTQINFVGNGGCP